MRGGGFKTARIRSRVILVKTASPAARSLLARVISRGMTCGRCPVAKRAQQKNSAERDAARADLLGTLARRAAGPTNDSAGVTVAGGAMETGPAGAVQSPPPALAERFTVDVVARELGVAAALVDELQRTVCNEATDFRHVHGVVVFTAAGVETVRRAIEGRMQAERSPTPPEKNSAEPATTGAEDLKLTRVFRWSTRLLAERANGLEVVLQVKSAKNLEAGMVLKDCRPGEFCWFYEGRLPRTLGERQLFYPERRA